MNDFINELKVKIVNTLDLVDTKPEDIGDDDILVGDNFGIDSIDVLELVIMIEEEYGVMIDNKELGEKVFVSIKTLAEHLHKHCTKTNE
ncbi:phosphopantetheine-binding protein [Thermodesulfobacteriota bacterium]